MQRLQGPRESVQERRPGGCVREGMDGRDEEIKGQAPVGEDGEVAEIIAGLGAAAQLLVTAVPSDLEQQDEENVQRLVWPNTQRVSVVRCQPPAKRQPKQSIGATGGDMRNRGRRRKREETYKQGAEARKDPRREQPRSLETVRRVPEVLAEGEWSRCHVALRYVARNQLESRRRSETKRRRGETMQNSPRNEGKSESSAVAQSR